jgi:hypothetical protein
MTPQERALYDAVLDAASFYVSVVNDPPVVPRDQTGWAEMRAFAALEVAVDACLDGTPGPLKTFVEPPEGAWSPNSTRIWVPPSMRIASITIKG